MLGSAPRPPVDRIVHHITDVCGREARERRVACRRDEARTEHAVLRRLLGAPGTGRFPAHEIRHATLTQVNGLLAQAPLVLTITDAQWCDNGTLRCIDHLMRGTAGEPLTVLLSLSHGALPAAGAAFHELVAREYCSVTDVADLWSADRARQPGTGGPAALDDLARHDPQVLRVAQAAALLHSTDADLVGALAGLPAGLVGRALDAARALGVLPQELPAEGASHHLDTLLGTLDAVEGERMRAQAAEILNDAARPAGQVADLLLAQSTLDRPWMTAILKEAATAARHEHPVSAVRYLSRLHRVDPDDADVRGDLAAVLLDIDPIAARTYLEPAAPGGRTGVEAQAAPDAGTQDQATLRATPDTPARAAFPVRLAGIMTHQDPDTPDGLGVLLRESRAGRPDRTTQAALLGGTTREHVALAARALRGALTATDLAGAVGAARQVLQAERPRTAWATVAAARVLGLADGTRTALEQLERTIGDSARREELWAECHARSARALLLLEAGHAYEAAEAALTASRTGQGQCWAERTHLASLTLVRALVARADLDRAEETLSRLDPRPSADSVWEHHHHLMARALLARARGRAQEALDLVELCGASLADAGVDNPVFTLWWVYSTDLHLRLGRPGPAAERAELGRHLAGRWRTPRSVGLSLLTRAMVAATADRVDLLTESVDTLADSSDRHSHAVAELHLGRALLQHGDKKAARSHLHAARAMAVRHGLTAVAEPARSALAAAGGRPTPVALTAAERPVAEMAAAGATNRAIADALFLTVRTVEYHLTNVYRKLGVTGRADLAERLPGPRTAPRVLGDER